MIREIIYDAVALVVFTLGGAFAGLSFLKWLSSSEKGIKAHLVDFCFGLLGAVVFLLLSEIYYGGVVTYYTLSCFAIGYVGVLAFYGESKKIALPTKLKTAFSKLKIPKQNQRKIKQKKKRENRVSKSRSKIKGIN
ncbi:MAG: hypothetical protein IJ033_00910 [Clostridia bacterium]|nr:hypothetical protein [Clostridia bacterium]